ncbi:glycosyl transferase family 2 [Erwinia persicina]|uniref:glycosyltransferase family 2 protein n=1 Tax=Erwinia persicina TaxID=55211 RepID=UPI000E51019F|nr:glycosyltransferase family 2 protein [Erwinia persicina]AXU94494.1 glycosyl transferase family 2 [Erwinia persicina]MBC3946948.1 glycosyltransferase family 2 protein [Erwinia persicina]MCQ4093251.1 glycosyltransferase family 2 protein [Erwinia persicina]MCQ4099019.1 glycosyltransferase family 2 protein [Erwinia persicina]
MNKSMPLVSIVTATFNSIRYIEDTYLCLKDQLYVNWEWLVTDDCSSDGTYEWLLKIAAVDSRVKVIRLAVNSGAAIARNTCLDRVSGEYIAFIDSDDLWSPQKLNEQISFMLNSAVRFSFTAYECVDSNGKSIGKIVDKNHNKKTFSYNDMLLKKATLGCSTVIIEKSLLKDNRMPNLRTGQDYAFWLVLLKIEDATYLNKCLSMYRILPGSISRNKIKKAKRQWQIYRKIEKLPLVTSVYCFCFYAYRAVFRK